MLNSTEIKPGMCFTWEGKLYQAINVDLNKTAMAKMKVKVKVKEPQTGVVRELSLISGDKVEQVFIDKRQMQFLYDAGDVFCFMDTESYEQIELPSASLEWEKNFLIESSLVSMMIYNGEVIGVILPDKVELQIVECEQAVKGNTATSAEKNAICETGLKIKVPLFIENEERVIVSTADGKYAGRA